MHNANMDETGSPEEKPTTTKPVGYLLIHRVKRKAGVGCDPGKIKSG
jgi:hypothetical protein